MIKNNPAEYVTVGMIQDRNRKEWLARTKSESVRMSDTETSGMSAKTLLDMFEAETNKLPMGAGAPVGWASKYNAQMDILRELRKIADAPSLDFEKPGAAA